ncbi:MAG: sensor histidine kinase [Nitrospinaceae bacterium]|nr:MAG: sensor histidine kinase [Nitrospinaceae bacterium]
MDENTLGVEILQDITRIANATLDLDETLEQIIEVIKTKLHTDSSSIYLADENSKFLILKASSGLPQDTSQFIRLEIGKGITGWVAENKSTLALSDAHNDPRFVYFPEIEEEKFKSMLSVPILVSEQCIGVVNVHSVEQRMFTDLEILIMETIASQMSGCIRNAMLYSNSQMLLKEQTIFYDISLAVQTSIKLEHGLWIILSGITMGEAGGFNRAMIFIINEKTDTLQGYMGLGPDSPEDAFRIWTEWGHKKRNMLQWVVSEADKDEYKYSAFNQFVESLNFPIQPNENILVETVIQKSPFNLINAGNHPLVSEEFIHALGTNSFATVPLIAHKEVLGVILVDNRYNNQPITDEQLRLLTRFATHASWVIENSRLLTKLLEANRELLSTKEQLVQSEKLAALGEISAEVAHEIKNPMVSIGGFARRLKKKIENFSAKHDHGEELESIAEYSNIIMTEVDRLEKLLTNILLYSKAGVLEREECDINELLEEGAFLFKSGFFMKSIAVHRQLEKNLPRLRLDKPKIKQVLINLIYNAMESMPSGGDLTLQTYRGEYIGGKNVITVRIEDTGGGIPQDIFENIFNPFFTTKSSGTGLGLSISRKIIEIHGGTIRVENNLGRGVTVFLHLPLQN